MPNYAYILFYFIYVLNAIVCFYNKTTIHVTYGGDSLDNDIGCKDKKR